MTDASLSAVSAVTQGDPVFAARLHRVLASTPGNLFFGPASIRLSLGMAYAGAAGSTADELRSALVFEGPAETHRGFRALLRVWSTWSRMAREPRNEWERVALERACMTLSAANRLFGARGYGFRAEFLSVLRDMYQAPLSEVDFGQAEPTRGHINGWVGEQTKGKIPELLAQGMITEDMRLVLVNAVYFKASWVHTFGKYWTKPGPFFLDATQSVETPLMTQTEYFPYAETNDAQVIELPYGSGEASMVVVLPRARDGLAALEAALHDGSIDAWTKALRPRRVHLTLPRFRISSGFRLKGALQSLGMQTAFDFGPADFSAMDGTRLLYVSDVVHKAFVDVDEEGTEAAAATATIAVAGAAPMKMEDPVPMQADHPFLFLLRDVRHGSVLFMGRLSNPVVA